MSKQFDHKKAEVISGKIDPHKDFVDMIVDKIHNAPENYTLDGLMKSLAAQFVRYEPEEAIAALQAIYEALKQEQEFIKQENLSTSNIDDLFQEAFSSMYTIAEHSYQLKPVGDLLEQYCSSSEE